MESTGERLHITDSRANAAAQLWDHGRAAQNVHQQTLRPFIKQFAAGADVLEAGCDSGPLLAYAVRAGARSVLGVDVQPDRVREAQRLFSTVQVPSRFIEADLQCRWPLESASVDVVICSEVIEHLLPHKHAEFIGEAARVLRPGGRLLLTTPNIERWFARSPVLRGDWDPNHHWSELSRDQLLGVLGLSGFDAVVTYYRYPKVYRWVGKFQQLAKLVERFPPRRHLAMNLLAVATKR
ncbi:class I SAM-dependent methyltransferase [Streptomyces sp. HNM0663]|uniref:Class I SAM-dependent methyltransferase n=1 Tax=Streptomyces chengmaiensis TaxID=3040919 RepID=A0ABT6HHK1_9ACTN|nr:class I SAM-dependent methyltransferase [Streptomyces chengmaiensis]MDH2387760.1 class I SAM-dependent methyltransferase [Streptomyces chengmaiensis]